MTLETVAVTGGNGKLGEEILQVLSAAGYRTVDIARGKRREDVSDEYRTTDLTQPGEVYGSLASAEPDAVIHMGTIPGPDQHPGYVTYENNIMSSYHVLEAATALDIDRICLPSSINAMGTHWSAGPTEVAYLPVDEAHPVAPNDPYSLAKHAMEVTADGFGRRQDAPSIASLRLPAIFTETELRTQLVDGPPRALEDDDIPPGRDDLFTYLHIEDAARAAQLAIETELDGHETFWTVAADTTLETPTAAVIDRCFPGADRRRTFEAYESLIDCSKAAELLGWTPEHSWRDLR
jgi:nucleoside-diphosphate-sugar epimerase